MTKEKTKKEVLTLEWLDPRNGQRFAAGVAFYNEGGGEYYLRIDEEPIDKNYYLKATSSNDGETHYRMELAVCAKDGTFLRRKHVGNGVTTPQTGSNIHINFGSKYKTLVLKFRKEKRV